jgi:hypothetical protein
MVSESKKHLLLKVDRQLSTLHGLVHVTYTRDEHDVTRNSIRLHLAIPDHAQARVLFELLFPGARCIKLVEGDTNNNLADQFEIFYSTIEHRT